jgi:hypothetical protein
LKLLAKGWETTKATSTKLRYAGSFATLSSSATALASAPFAGTPIAFTTLLM